MRESTGKKDAKGKEIFVGDKVRNARYPSTIWTVAKSSYAPYLDIVDGNLRFSMIPHDFEVVE